MSPVLEYQAIVLLSLLIVGATLSVLAMLGIYIGVFPDFGDEEDDDEPR
jgi:hypothetical protein